MLWQKSPQYAGMPHEQYMQTAEGKKSQQAFQQWEQWQQNNMPTPSKPGPGRPSVPMQPQGIAPSKPAVPMPQYGQPGGMTPSKPGPARPSVPMMQNYAPGQAQSQQSPYATSTAYGGRLNQAQPQQSPDPTRQSLADQGYLFREMQQPAAPMPMAGQQAPAQPTLQQYMAPGNPLPGPTSRPSPFQATTQNFDGTTSQMPNFQQRDAFISQINNQLGQMQQQSWQRPGMGAPQFNFPQMWGQAGKMAEQGFRNPFAAPAGRMMSPSALADLAPGWENRPLPPLPPGAVY